MSDTTPLAGTDMEGSPLDLVLKVEREYLYAFRELERERDQARAWACEGQEKLAEVARLAGYARLHVSGCWCFGCQVLAVAEGAPASTETTTFMTSQGPYTLPRSHGSTLVDGASTETTT